MERPSQLVLVRHAESLRNFAKAGSVYFPDDETREIVQGIPDHNVPLTDFGKQQSIETGVAIKDRYGIFDYIYHSGYRRTIETKDGILQAYTPAEIAQMEVRENSFIRERDPGYTYDMTKDEVAKNFPWFEEYWKTFGGFMGRPLGGESLADVVNRVYTFLGMLFRERKGENVMVITHGGTLRCFRYLLERWNYEQAMTWNGEAHPENCSVTNYKFDKKIGRLALQSYNKTFWNKQFGSEQ